jgi:imidazolonepropionase
MSLAITNIASLVTNDENLDLGLLGEISNAAIVINEGKMAWVGESSQTPDADEHIDAMGKAVIPGFVDSHAHLLFAGDRVAEFSARMSGASYSAGGIASTVSATRTASDETLEQNLKNLISELIRSGVTTFETKSGYGLTAEDEARALRLASKHTKETTFLGAHVVPKEYAGKEDDYVKLVCGEMLEQAKPYSKWIDVFCDRGAFDADQAREILQSGIRAGLSPRIHANQLQHGEGVKLAIELECASADHCTHLTAQDIDLLAQSQTVATLLPGAEFSTRSDYPDARRLWDAGVKVAIATDCNPGSSYTTSMPFAIAVAIREMHFTSEQALWSATAGGAKALRRSDIGLIREGAAADLVILDAPSFAHLGYRPGVDLIQTVMRSGEIIHERDK